MQGYKKAIARLEKLRDVAVNNMFERVQIARQLLADTDYLADEFDGDQTRAADYLRERYFPDLGEYIPLLKLTAIADMFPSESEWQENRYNIRAMEAIYDQRREAESNQRPRRKRNVATLDQLEQLRIENSELKRQLRLAKQEIASLKAKINELQTVEV